MTPPKIFFDGLDPKIDYSEKEAAEDDAYVWGRFCGIVWDTLAKGAARDLVNFRKTCDRLWRPFTAPIVDGTFGTRDFARLMVSRRGIFQNEDVLLHNVVRKQVNTETARSKGTTYHSHPDYNSLTQKPTSHT